LAFPESNAACKASRKAGSESAIDLLPSLPLQPRPRVPMRRTGLTHTIHRRLRIHHHHGNRIAIDRHRAAIAAVVATVLQRFEMENKGQTTILLFF